MKAAVCYSFGAPLVVEDISIDPPQTGEVQVRLAATAVCHSDLHLISGDWLGPLPVVAGHEAAGIVSAIGAGVTGVKPGDRVIVSLLRSCGACLQCRTGARNNCRGAFPLDRESRLHNGAGQPLAHGINCAAFAEEAIVDQSQVVAIPEEMPLDRAALLGCGVITGVGAVLNTARVGVGESVAVIGAGGVGLNAIQGAVLAGAHPIIAVDRIASKLDAALAFGATRATLEPKEVRKVDYAFVTVGVPEAVSAAQQMIRPGGTIVVVGMPALKAALSLRMFDLVWSEQRILGSRMGSANLQLDAPRLVDLYLRGRLKLDELITTRYPLDDINEAIASMGRGEALRNVIAF
jgi:Zn-dependent alcohol dehydrogenase